MEEQKYYENPDKSRDKPVGMENCKVCKGLGFILKKQENGQVISRYCDCAKKKISREKFERTEIANKYNYTFKNFQAKEDWQKDILNTAKEYIESYDGNDWFYIGGQVGAGKTHICTAILRNLGELNNITYAYIKCDEELEKLKQLTYEQQEKHNDILVNLKNVDLLFIDDFLRKMPTETDKSKLFDIINYRYLNNKACIFSSEKILGDILNIDEGIGSRIFEKAKNFTLGIENDFDKNYRLK